MLTEPRPGIAPLLAAFLGLIALVAAGCSNGTTATTTTHPVQSRSTESTVESATATLAPPQECSNGHCSAAATTVPNVIGMPIEQAQTTLAAVSLDPRVIPRVATNTEQSRVVIRQAPAPGSKVAVGSLVTLTTSAPSTSPSVEAKTYCHDLLTATSVPQETLPKSPRTEALQAGEHSGDPGLDAAAAALLKVWNQPNSSAFLHALEKVNSACTRLGLAPPSGLAPTSG